MKDIVLKDFNIKSYYFIDDLVMTKLSNFLIKVHFLVTAVTDETNCNTQFTAFITKTIFVAHNYLHF